MLREPEVPKESVGLLVECSGWLDKQQPCWYVSTRVSLGIHVYFFLSCVPLWLWTCSVTEDDLEAIVPPASVSCILIVGIADLCDVGVMDGSQGLLHDTQAPY